MYCKECSKFYIVKKCTEFIFIFKKLRVEKYYEINQFDPINSNVVNLINCSPIFIVVALYNPFMNILNLMLLYL